jgi:predicted nuclease with TOPRIM domain
MDVETAAAIERLSDGIAGLEQSSRREMAELRGDLSELRGEVTELRGEMTELRGELREGLAENRRHAGVLFESLRDDIRVLAEGFATVSTKLDSLQR